MKDFFKYTLATVTGIVLSVAILGILFIVMLISVTLVENVPTKISRPSVWKLELNGVLRDRGQEDAFDFLGGLIGETGMVYGLDDLLLSIQKAKHNPFLQGIYLEAGNFSASYASLQEMRNALLDFKESGKFIVAYGDNYTQNVYYLASVADKVLLNPQGKVEWSGLSSTPIFYRDLLQKIGVEMQIFKVGTYKSAVEPYTSTQMSDANREQMNSVLQSVWEQMLEGVSACRHLPKDSLDSYANRMLMFYSSLENVRSGMVDSLMYRSDVEHYLQTFIDNENEDISLVNSLEMLNLRDSNKRTGDKTIAVYYASGEIVDGGNFMPGYIVGSSMVEDLNELKEDDNVNAVVIRVNSPGGSAFASEQICHAVKELKAVKPVVVSMGNYAASGGYYISCMANRIVAQPTTLTGSIGIFGMIPSVKGLADKIGVTTDVVKTHQFSDFGSLMRPLNGEESRLMQMNIDQGYETFVARCAEGRGMPVDSIELIAEGRVWTGAMAQKIGLVDDLGGIDMAVEIAASLAGIKEENYVIHSYPGITDWIDQLFTSSVGYMKQRAKKEALGEYYNVFEFINNVEIQSPVQARLPFVWNVN